MKKILLGSVMMFGFVGMFSIAQAEYNTDYNKAELTAGMVEKIIGLYDDGYTQEQIVDKLILEKKEVTKINHVKTANFGQFTKTLRNGDSNDQVQILQGRLNNLATKLGLSFDYLSVDGDFGPATARAVRLFQAYKGLTADGVVGEKTMEKLEHFFNKIQNDSDDDEIDPEYDNNDSYDYDGEITLSVEKTDTGVTLEWDVDDMDTPHGFKVVKSLDSNPVYPGDDYKYLSDKNIREYNWKINSDKEYNFRVCAYLGNGKCGVYSNNISVI